MPKKQSCELLVFDEYRKVLRSISFDTMKAAKAALRLNERLYPEYKYAIVRF